MKAGRELDALIAENVMEWTGPPLSDGHHTWFKDGVLMACEECGHFLPRFSADISAAFQVVEKLLATPDRNGDLPLAVVVRVEHGYPEVDPMRGGRVLCIIETGVANEDIEEYADTAPHAICLAARKAVGEKGAG